MTTRRSDSRWIRDAGEGTKINKICVLSQRGFMHFSHCKCVPLELDTKWDKLTKILHFSAVFRSYTSSLSCGNQLIGCCFCWWSYRNQPFVSCCVSCFTSINNHISCIESLRSLWWKLGDIRSLWALPFKQIYASQPDIHPGWASVTDNRGSIIRRVTIMCRGKVSTKGVS